MDPLSITTACVGIIGAVTKVSIQINDFVRKAREARGDLDAVSRELVSLKTVLEILSGDAKTGKGFPDSLVKQISGILTNCSGVLDQIETSLQKHAGGGITPAVKWTLSGRDDMTKLRSSLEAHKSALDIALDMVSLSITREIKADTQEIRNDTSAIKEDTTQILAEIARLQARLPEGERVGGANGFALQRYLDNLTSYAESSWEISDIESDHQAEVGTPRGESSSPPLDNISIVQEPMIIQNTVNVHATRSAEYRALSKNYNILSPIHTQHQNDKAINPKPDAPLFKAPKPSETVDTTLGKQNSMIRSESISHNEKQTILPKLFSTTSISRPPSVSRASKNFTDSRRSTSFGFGRRRSESLSGSEPTIQQYRRTVSPLISVSSVLKAFGKSNKGKNKSYPPVSMESLHESKSETIVGMRSNTPPHPLKFARVAGMSSSENSGRMRTPTFRTSEPNLSIGDYLFGGRSENDDDDDDLSDSIEEPWPLPRAQLPLQNRQVAQPRGRGVLEKNNRKFADAYGQELDYHNPENGAARKVMDYFRRRGRAKGAGA